jgi:prefoldin subunit 5
MPTLEEKLNEVQERFNMNVAQAQQIEQQIAKLQEQLRGLQQPLIEDQGAIKTLKEILEPVEQTA